MRGASGKPCARQRRTVCEDHAGTRSVLRALSPFGVARRSASRTPRGAAAPAALTDFHGPLAALTAANLASFRLCQAGPDVAAALPVRKADPRLSKRAMA